MQRQNDAFKSPSWRGGRDRRPGTCATNDRLLAGAQHEADSQAYAQMAQMRGLYEERVATLGAEGQAVALYPAVIAALVDGNAKPPCNGQHRFQGSRAGA